MSPQIRMKLTILFVCSIALGLPKKKKPFPIAQHKPHFSGTHHTFCSCHSCYCRKETPWQSLAHSRNLSTHRYVPIYRVTEIHKKNHLKQTPVTQSRLTDFFSHNITKRYNYGFAHKLTLMSPLKFQKFLFFSENCDHHSGQTNIVENFQLLSKLVQISPPHKLN